MIYFISDEHYGHSRVLDFCKKTRPFKTIEDHDQHLIDAHNRTVKNDNDEVWHLGDFYFGTDRRRAIEIFSSLRGRHHLIVGNHDKQIVKHLPWMSVQDYKLLKYEKHKFILMHYPLAGGQWDCAHYGSFHLHGHTHSKYQYSENVRAMDVGIDSIGFSPISIETVMKKMEKIGNYPVKKVEDAN